MWSTYEFQAKKLLKSRRISQALSEPPLPADERRSLVEEFLALSRQPENVRNYPLGKPHFQSYAQACYLFCRSLLELCQRHSGMVLAAIIEPDAMQPINDLLEADYVALFAKLYENCSGEAGWRSLIIHDERDDAQCRVLARQLYAYYLNEGGDIVERVIPEPLFVTSHLTLGVLVADIVVYVLSWGFRHADVLRARRRLNLAEYAELIRQINRIPLESPPTPDEFGIVYIDDLTDLTRWTKKR